VAGWVRRWRAHDRKIEKNVKVNLENGWVRSHRGEEGRFGADDLQL
jgi:hypothetical protein